MHEIRLKIPGVLAANKLFTLISGYEDWGLTQLDIKKRD